MVNFAKGLDAHGAKARRLLYDSVTIGRLLNFLTQEFSSATKRLWSRMPQMELTRGGLALKSAIDQLRKQVQDLE